MKKINKLIIASVLFIVIGMGLMITGSLLGGRVYGLGLNQNGFYVNTPVLNDSSEISYIEEELDLKAFNSIDAETDFTDIEIVSGDRYGIKYKINSQSKFTYEIANGVLKIKEIYKNANDSFVNFQWFSFGSFDSSFAQEEYVKIYVPENVDLANISIENSFGDVSLSELNTKEVTVQSDFSDITIHDLTVTSLTVNTDSGNLEIENTTGDTLSLHISFGDTELSQLHFNETSELTSDNGSFDIEDSYFYSWNINSDFGDVNGNTVSCDTASLTLDNGNCELNNFTVNSVDAESSFGDICLQLSTPVDTYSYDLRTEFGSIDLEGYDTEEDALIISTDSDKQINIDCESGDIKISDS